MVTLDFKGSTPIYEQIVEQMKFHVMRGHLQSGDSIPSVRRLALELKITPGTVAKAYQELERQGIIETIRGKGTFIAAKLELKVDEAKLSEIKRRIRTDLMELKMMGYDRKMILELIKGMYEEMSV